MLPSVNRINPRISNPVLPVRIWVEAPHMRIKENMLVEARYIMVRNMMIIHARTEAKI